MATLTTTWQKLGEAYIGSSAGNLYVRLYARYTTQDITNNRSYVEYEARAYFTGGYIRDDQGFIAVSGTGGSYTRADCHYPTIGETISVKTGGWVSHNSSGVASVSCAADLTFPNWGWYNGVSTTASLPTIPRKAVINSAPNFFDDENPTITYSNPAGNSVSTLQACISLTGATDDIKYRDISKTGSSYTFELTEEERNILRLATLNGSDKRDVMFFIRTIIGGVTYYSSLTRTLTISNCTPTMSTTMVDINPATTSLTEDNSVVVNYKSIVRITPTTQTFKGSSIVKITANGNIIDGDYIDLTGANKYEIVATDNRGLTATVIYQSSNEELENYFKLIDYIPLTINATFKRKAPTTGEINVDYSGNYFNGDFSETNHNQLTVKYRAKEKDSEWTGEEIWYNLTPSVQDNTFSEDITLEQLYDYRKNYTFEIKAEDSLETSIITEITIIKGIPIYWWDEHNVYITEGDLYVRDNKIPCPSVALMKTNTRVIITDQIVCNGYEEKIELGDYEADTQNGRLVIRNTKMLQLAGGIAGYGSFAANFEVLDEDGNIVNARQSNGILVQKSGNGFLKVPMQNIYISLNPDQVYYVRLVIQGYYDTFDLNAGFGLEATWISAKRIV